MFKEGTHTTENHDDSHVASSNTSPSIAYCARCTMAEIEGSAKFCDDCKEIVRKEEVAAVVERAGVTPDQLPVVGSQSSVAILTDEQLRLIEFLGRARHVNVDVAVRALFGGGYEQVIDLSLGDADKFIRHLHSLPKNGNGSTEPIRHNQGGYPGGPVVQIRGPVDTEPHWTESLGADYQTAHDEAEMLGENDFPDYPVEFVRTLVKENNKISKREVESVLAEFQMSVSLGDIATKADAIVVTDRSQKALMKQARELRLTLRKERLRIEQMRVEVKEPHLRRVQVIDGLGRMIRDLFKEKEAHLQLQEDFEKIENARIAAELQAERIGELAQFEYIPSLEDLDGVTFGKMTDAEWTAFRSEVETAYLDRKAQEAAAIEAKRIEDERLTRENAALRLTQARAFQLVDLGFRLDGNRYSFEDIRVDLDTIKDATDNEWTAMLSSLTVQADIIKTAQQAIKDRNDKIRNRTASLTSIGMAFNGERFAFEGHLTYTLDEITEADDTVFGEIVTAANEKIMSVRLEQQRLQDTKDRIEKERVEQEAAAKLAAMAPDKEKLEAWASAIESVEEPMMASDLTRQIRDQFLTKVKAATADMRRQLAQL